MSKKDMRRDHRHDDLHNRLRSFGRSYTKRFGLLHRNPYHESLSLLQARIIFEIHQHGEILSSELAEILHIDKGYLSRSIAQLSRDRLLKFQTNSNDKRKKFLRLSKKGETLFSHIDTVSANRVEELLRGVRPAARRDLAAHLSATELLMGEKPLRRDEIKLRSFRPGDIGWVIGRHGEIYNQEFGWNMEFECLVGEIAVEFASRHDPKKERVWIAEARDIRLGCVFLVKDSNEVAKLRILLVDPMARGLGLGRRLVKECIKGARKAGYKKLTLWTNSVLHSARKIYISEGFHLVSEEPHHSFGKDLIGQYWELDLSCVGCD